MISFLLGDQRVDLADLDPNTTVLDWLRANGRTGTKEGCASGDCGACTVTTVRTSEDGLDYRAVNSCIALVGSLDGAQLVTVEDLADPDSGELHPVQRAMVDRHGSQCGFCTPGFVMSLFTWTHRDPSSDRHDIDEALAGNLCRCTGYRPIIDAARDVATTAPPDRFDSSTDVTSDNLRRLALDREAAPARLTHDTRSYIAPRTIAEAITVLADEPEAVIVTGGTDLVLEITQGDRRFECLVDLSNVIELGRIEVTNQVVRVGAAVPLTDLVPTLVEHWPATAELWERYGSVPIRNRATLGGNLGNASPIGDSPPLLLALAAEVVVAGSDGQRRVSLDDLFVDYRTTVLAPGEFIAMVEIPLPFPNQRLSVSKVSKRIDDDISAVCGIFNLTLDDATSPATISAARVAFGGMAATPKRALACEQQLVGKTLDGTTLAAARLALADEFTPIDDMRASGAYRGAVAGNLLERAFIEATGTPQRVGNLPRRSR